MMNTSFDEERFYERLRTSHVWSYEILKEIHPQTGRLTINRELMIHLVWDLMSHPGPEEDFDLFWQRKQNIFEQSRADWLPILLEFREPPDERMYAPWWYETLHWFISEVAERFPEEAWQQIEHLWPEPPAELRPAFLGIVCVTKPERAQAWLDSLLDNVNELIESELFDLIDAYGIIGGEASVQKLHRIRDETNLKQIRCWEPKDSVHDFEFERVIEANLKRAVESSK